MQSWKLSIFVNAVKIRVANGEGTAEEIVDSYTKLTSEEKAEILAVANS